MIERLITSAPSHTGGKRETDGDVRLHRQIAQGDRCRQEFCGVNNQSDRWFEYACRLREARIINSHCQIEAPKDAVKWALSKTIIMVATSLNSQRTNADSSPSNSADWMPLISLLASSRGGLFSHHLYIALEHPHTGLQNLSSSQWRER